MDGFSTAQSVARLSGRASRWSDPRHRDKTDRIRQMSLAHTAFTASSPTYSALTAKLASYGRPESRPSGTWISAEALLEAPTYVSTVWDGSHHSSLTNLRWTTPEATLDVTLLSDSDSVIGIETDDPELMVSIVQRVLNWGE